MSMFNLAISRLTTSNLPWSICLKSQFSMHYFHLKHQNLLLPPDTSTIEYHFGFGPVASFFLKSLVIALHVSPVAYWIPSDWGAHHIFLPFHTIHGVPLVGIWSGLPFLPSVDHILSEFFTMIHPSWVVLQGMAYSFIELCKLLCQDKAVIHEGTEYDYNYFIKLSLSLLWNLLYEYNTHARGNFQMILPCFINYNALSHSIFLCIKIGEVKSEVTQSCPTLCNPMDCSLPCSSVHGIFQAKVLEWVVISFSRGSSQPRDWTWVSHIVVRCFTIWATWEVIKLGSIIQFNNWINI